MQETTSEPQEPKHTNRLIDESSPYLLQHAHNPVDWYPWGTEAFEAAREQDKPIFLSIGYSTCHWCHVMERESFESEEIAAVMNEHFICIKVDREERPDVDSVYMSAVTKIAGRGGWPMSVFMTPDRKPFFGGTYFPPHDQGGRRGFSSILLQVAGLWKENRAGLISDANRLTEAVRGGSTPGAEDLDIGILTAAFNQYDRMFDEEEGGFGRPPKFPRSHNLSFLLRFWERTGEPRAIEMVTTTLDKMVRGGMYDQLGGGFHRYSTDRVWLLPHFEKMLYDQALLARTYLEAYQATGEQRFADVARDVFRYVLRDMTDAKGGFYSAEDADSEGEEGRFYVWTREEILKVLGKEDGAFFAETYGATERGNFQEEAGGGRSGHNILHLKRSIEELAKERGDEELDARLSRMRDKLFDVREPRVHPYKDDKILTDWNGLMISALALGGRALDEPRYLDAARKAGGFVLDVLDRDGRLLHRYRRGSADIPAFLDDYAFLSLGFLDLYEATFEDRWLRESIRLSREMIRLFWDEKEKGFFFTAIDGESLIARTREVYDGAVPSGNSVAALVLVRLARITSDADFGARAAETLKAFGASVKQSPTGYPMMLQALGFDLGPSQEIVLAGDPDDPVIKEMIREVRSRFLPRAIVALHRDGAAGRAIEELAPFLKLQASLGGKATAYVCENYACKLPVHAAKDLAKLLDSRE